MSNTLTFTTTPLYGGAITADLPSNFNDASKFRQIPSHQEVHLSSTGYTSIVIDILEYVDKPSDEEALQFHFTDLVDGTGDSTNILGTEGVQMGKTPNKPVYHLSFIQTPQSSSNPTANPNRKEPEFVAIHLFLLRLKDYGTDIVITINVPHYPGEYEKASAEEEEQWGKGVTALMKEGEVIARSILESFEVKDWGLFDG